MSGRLKRLYAQIPQIDCKGKCASECVANFPVSQLEARNAAREAGRDHPAPPRAHGYCPYLNAGRCTVHAARPMLCRLYGVWERLPCKFGCVPDRMLSDAEGQAYLDKSLEITK